MKTPGPYIAVALSMPRHEKVEALSDRAFRVLIESWCYCAEQRTDGRIGAAKWSRTATPKVRSELVKGGLIDPESDGSVFMHGFLEWQMSRDDVADNHEARRRGGQLTTHQRWHVERNVIEPNCPLCPSSQEQPDTDQSEQGSSGLLELSEQPSQELVADRLAPGLVLDKKGVTRQEREGARAKRAISLPDDWQPTDAHRALATERGVDCDHVAEVFRASAEANDRKQASWHAYFRQWLLKERPTQAPQRHLQLASAGPNPNPSPRIPYDPDEHVDLDAYQ